jgi:type II secretory pathway pseudopilin PulG
MIATKKIPAFTLNEMLVVLLLTVIIVGMAFSVLSLVQNQMHGIDSNLERNTELNQLRQSLWIDFNSCDEVWYDTKKQELLFANEIRQTPYHFYADYVVNERDTFHVKIDTKVFYFKGDIQGSGEIDAMDLGLGKENRSQKLFVYKKNAATSYINQ